MNHFKVLILFYFIFLCSASSVFAETDPCKDKHPHGEFGQKLFIQMDDNQDHYITLKELSNFHQKMFDKVDINHDGKLTLKETKQKNFDKDYHAQGKKGGKGYLTFEDTFEVEKNNFQKCDMNKDGKVTMSEFKKHYLEECQKI